MTLALTDLSLTPRRQLTAPESWVLIDDSAVDASADAGDSRGSDAGGSDAGCSGDCDAGGTGGAGPTSEMAMRRHASVPLVALLLLGLALTACASAGSNVAPAPTPAARGAGSSGPGGAANTPPGQPSADRMIARTARIELAVADPAAGAEAAGALATRVGGVVVSSSVRADGGGGRVATLSLRVPAARYDEVMAELRRLAVRVDAESAEAQDVTEQYADQAARLRNLEATEQQYLELLKRAGSVEDVLKVQERLGDVRTQIDQLNGRLQLLQARVDTSLIEVTMRPPAAGFRPLRNVAAAWQGSLSALEAAIGVAVAGWWVWLLIGLGWWALGRRRARTPAAPAAPLTGPPAA